MPYIVNEDRKRLDGGPIAETPGELAFLLTTDCLLFLGQFEEGFHNYATVVGVLEAVKMEFYRRAVAPYEDRKIQEHGDVY
jgi:hypothetical protein